jgi:hypothetical protein
MKEKLKPGHRKLETIHGCTHSKDEMLKRLEERFEKWLNP